jgi:hypothetical protein
LKQPLPITTSLQSCVAGSMRASFGNITAWRSMGSVG